MEQLVVLKEPPFSGLTSRLLEWRDELMATLHRDVIRGRPIRVMTPSKSSLARRIARRRVPIERERSLFHGAEQWPHLDRRIAGSDCHTMFFVVDNFDLIQHYLRHRGYIGDTTLVWENAHVYYGEPSGADEEQQHVSLPGVLVTLATHEIRYLNPFRFVSQEELRAQRLRQSASSRR